MIIKVCGMREASNIKEVENLGIDMMGFIFYSKSPRFVSSSPSYLPQNCKRVGVFVNESNEYILNKASEYSLNLIQLHGNESPRQCRELKTKGYEIIKAFSINSDVVSNSNNADYINIITKDYLDVCNYFLFDTKCNEFGGSGKKFNWKILSLYTQHTPFILSGGIDTSNMDEIMNFSHPSFTGIDLNSKFEEKPGLKQVNKLKVFINKIRTNKI